jgi:carbon-monoxide dehydrogenase medium subunit
MQSFEFVDINDKQSAVKLLDAENSLIRPQSGGTALMLMMKSGIYHPEKLINLRNIKELRGIKLGKNNELVIGSMTTLSEIEHSDLVKLHAPVISKTMKKLANVRVRNVARIGGALAHGDPHMDLPPLLSALGGIVVTLKKDTDKNRQIPIKDLYKGYYETSLLLDEIITEVHIPSLENRKTSYLKSTTRSADDWPAVGVAVNFSLINNKFHDVQIVLGSINEIPYKLLEVEKYLENKNITDEVIRTAGKLAQSTIEPISDSLGSAEYKKQLVKVFLIRALNEAILN